MLLSTSPDQDNIHDQYCSLGEAEDQGCNLQGAEDGIEGVRDGLGWTLSVSEPDSRMVLTASGDEVAFVIFGACTSL